MRKNYFICGLRGIRYDRKLHEKPIKLTKTEANIVANGLSGVLDLKLESELGEEHQS